jgi:plasmid stabilization system protein ParE
LNFRVRYTREAVDDLERLFDFLLERELERGGDLDVAVRALDAIKDGIQTLSFSPFTCRKAGTSPFLRELIIPFGRNGYVALFEIEGEALVTVCAVRHQREEDYH